MPRKKKTNWTGKKNGQYTRYANAIFDTAENGACAAGRAADNALAYTVGGVMGAGSALGSAGNSAYDSALSHGQDFNEWAQGLSNPNDGIYPYTRDDDLTGNDDEQ